MHFLQIVKTKICMQYAIKTNFDRTKYESKSITGAYKSEGIYMG